MKKIEIKKGDRYGRLIILKEIEPKRIKKRPSGNRRVVCLCDCGNITDVFLNDIRSSKTTSCGCLGLESSIKNVIKATEANITHKMSKTKTYKAWSAMIQRCYNIKNKFFFRYGGRGIRVCDRWKNSFENFLKDMGMASKGLTLERIDNNKGYYKENCKWATWEDQARNKSNNKYITYNNKTLCYADWSKKLFGDKQIITHRINQLGWSPLEALLTPKQKHCL